MDDVVTLKQSLSKKSESDRLFSYMEENDATLLRLKRFLMPCRESFKTFNIATGVVIGFKLLIFTKNVPKFMSVQIN